MNRYHYSYDVTANIVDRHSACALVHVDRHSGTYQASDDPEDMRPCMYWAATPTIQRYPYYLVRVHGPRAEMMARLAALAYIDGWRNALRTDDRAHGITYRP